ncbi:MAG: hypothetical protein ABI474_10870 [Actinomycetota bacterium]
MRYIELNPVRARMVAQPEDYPWSSYRHNAGFDGADWLTPHDEYRCLGAPRSVRAQAWREFVSTAWGDDELAAIRNHVNRNRVLGDSRFQQRIAEMLGRRVDIAPLGRPWPARADKAA